MPAKKTITPFNIWIDPATPGVDYTHEQFMHRLREVYKVDPKTTKARKEMLMHMDGDTWFDWQYKVHIPLPDGKTLEAVNHTRTMRKGSNLRQWQHG